MFGKMTSGKIDFVSNAVIDGTTHFYYVINGNLYRSPITLNEEQVMWKVGDELVFSYYDNGAIRVVTDIKKN